MAMSSIGRKEYVAEAKLKYLKAVNGGDKKAKSQIINEAVSFTGLHRKYLTVLLRTTTKSYRPGLETANRRGPRPRYNDPSFIRALLVCWRATNQSCAENLQPWLSELVPKLESCGELEITNDTRRLLLSASISTVARRLYKQKTRDRIPLGTTKPGSMLKVQIPVRKGVWNEANPGWLETDTVAHGGASAEGRFIHSYNFVDIATSWSEQIAVMGIGEQATVAGLKTVQSRLPFQVLGIDSDNGGEFINWNLYHYCQKCGIGFTRSRRYKKNDNAHVEQKNYTAIRKIVGYARLDNEEQLTILNKLYDSPLRIYLNFFQPTRKRKTKELNTKTGKTKKYYFEAATPYQRVINHPMASEETKQLLQSQYNNLNPVKLLAEIRTLIERLNRTIR